MAWNGQSSVKGQVCPDSKVLKYFDSIVWIVPCPMEMTEGPQMSLQIPESS